MAAKKPISQSDTRWVKRPGKRGYVEQVSTGKRVTGKVKLVANTTKGKAGETQMYKKGVAKKVTPMAKGAGVKPGTPGKSASAASRTGSTGSGMPRANPTPTANPVSARQQRKANNAGVAAGTVRVGANKKSVRKYNAKTGRWTVVQQGGNTTTANQNQNQSRPETAKPPTAAKPTSGGSGPFSGSGTPSVYAQAQKTGEAQAKNRAASGARYAALARAEVAKAKKAGKPVPSPLEIGQAVARKVGGLGVSKAVSDWAKTQNFGKF